MACRLSVCLAGPLHRRQKHFLKASQSSFLKNHWQEQKTMSLNVLQTSSYSTYSFQIVDRKIDGKVSILYYYIGMTILIQYVRDAGVLQSFRIQGSHRSH